MKQMSAILLDHGHLARDDVEELVFLLVPVPVGRARARLERVDVGAELLPCPRVNFTLPAPGYPRNVIPGIATAMRPHFMSLWRSNHLHLEFGRSEVYDARLGNVVSPFLDGGSWKG